MTVEELNIDIVNLQTGFYLIPTNLVFCSRRTHILIDRVLINVPLENVLFIWRRQRCRWKAAKFKPLFSAYSL